MLIIIIGGSYPDSVNGRFGGDVQAFVNGKRFKSEEIVNKLRNRNGFDSAIRS